MSGSGVYALSVNARLDCCAICCDNGNTIRPNSAKFNYYISPLRINQIQMV